jgi:hypothetical protein
MFVLGCVLLLLGVFGVLFFVLHDPAVHPSTNGTGSSGTDWSTEPVRIDGNVVEPISPGLMVPLDLTFTNPHDAAISITDLTVAVHDVDAPNSTDTHTCPIGDFTVDQAPSDLRVTLAARATNSLSGLGLPSATWPRMGMLNRPVNQDGCKGASLTLAYTASGTGETR